jgi:hypothetical protein
MSRGKSEEKNDYSYMVSKKLPRPLYSYLDIIILWTYRWDCPPTPAVQQVIGLGYYVHVE